MNPGADRLPIDVLEMIFSYLPREDLVESVQFVCTWWQQVSWGISLWKHVMYKPNTKNENVVQMLKISPQLRILNLKYATINSNLIQFIAYSCPNLEHLVVHWDSIYNNPDVIITQPLSQIKILSLPCTAISRLDFPYLDSTFPNLENLNINLMSFNRKDLVRYLEKKQDSLHTLSISCRTEDELCVLPCLSVCTKLRNLSLYAVCHDVGSWKEVGHLANISHLTLLSSRVSIMVDSLEVLHFFPNITALVMNNCHDFSENVVSVITRNCPQLQKLKFSDYCSCFSISMALSKEQLIYLERLTHLYMYQNKSLNDEWIKHLQLMPQLIHLDLYDCVSVTTGCLKSICGFSKLEVLKFDLHNQPLPADLRASDVKNKTLQLMFYNCRDVSSLESLRRQHLSVCLTGYISCKICCSRMCQKEYCTCWIERYNCIMDPISVQTFVKLLFPNSL